MSARNSLHNAYQTFQTGVLSTWKGSKATPSLLILPDDIFHLIFTHLQFKHIKALSSTCIRLRHVAAPKVLRTINLTHEHGLPALRDALCSLVRCEKIDQYARTMKLAIQIEIDQPPFLMAWDPCVKDIVSFVGTRLRRLERLHLDLDVHTAQIWQHYFDQAGWSLPTVRDLTVSYGCEKMLARCPHVVRLGTNQGFQHCPENLASEEALVRNAAEMAGSGRLRELTLYSQWTIHTAQVIVQYLPQLRALRMFTDEPATRLSNLLPYLADLDMLRTLEIDTKFVLEGWTWRGMWTTKDTISVNQKAVCTSLFQGLKRVDEVRYGAAFRAWVVSRYDDGGFDVQWEDIVPVLPCSVEKLEALEKRELREVEDGVSLWSRGAFQHRGHYH